MSAAILLIQAANQGNDMDPMHLDFRVAFDKCFTWCPWRWDGEMRIGSEDRKWSHSWMNNHSQRMLISFSVSTQRSLVAHHRALPLCWPYWHCYLWLRRQPPRCSNQVCSRHKAGKHSYHHRWQNGNKKWPQQEGTRGWNQHDGVRREKYTVLHLG